MPTLPRRQVGHAHELHLQSKQPSVCLFIYLFIASLQLNGFTDNDLSAAKTTKVQTLQKQLTKAKKDAQKAQKLEGTAHYYHCRVYLTCPFKVIRVKLNVRVKNATAKMILVSTLRCVFLYCTSPFPVV